jgi:asparagine synthase (glutamine-hydrolysing)
MCGIAGYFGTQPVAPEFIRNSLGLMNRRGPDSASFFEARASSGRYVYLLHSRLNIIDLSDRANQPFQEESKTLVYNGEIYNYLELAKELAAAGKPMRTSSDTEVLITMLAQKGWQGLDRCEGMWAFAVYDDREETLLLSRDRFGEKPLYFFKDATGIYFGSEIKFIAALRNQPFEVNYDHLYRYMVNGYKSLYKGRDTFYKGVEEVRPGGLLRIDSQGREKAWSYWTPVIQKPLDLSYEEVTRKVRDALIRSVELRLRADVPLAFCMSGGVDSNSLISIAKKVLGYNVHGFTISNTDARYEEDEMVQYSAKTLGIRHTSIPVTTDKFLERLRTLVIQHDAPVLTITYYAQWLLMKSIAEHGYRISVSGTAADELFSGYYDHHLAYLYQVRDDKALYESSKKNWLEKIQPIVRNPYLRKPDLFFENPGMRDYLYLNSEEFSQFLFTGWSEAFEEEKYTEDLLRNRMLNELFHENVPPILHEDDLNAMYYSIENRSPFLDRNLFELSSQIPTKYLVRNGYAKAVLRDSMRGIVPDGVLNSWRKVGFNAPVFSFLDVEDPKVREYLLDDSPIYDHLRRDRVEAMFKKSDLPNSESKFLFYFLNSKIFLEEAAKCNTVKSA